MKIIKVISLIIVVLLFSWKPTLEGLEKTKDFVTKNAQFEFPNGLLKNEMSDPKANLICLDCFDFYKSKELNRFVRKMERELRE